MTSIVKLEALSGVRDDGPLCYLLQVDEAFILLDCGWDESFDLAYIDAVKARIPQISAVLLSYADPLHLGALPYLVAKCGLNAPIYATVPVFKMGHLFMYDWVNGHTSVEEFDHFSLDDVDFAFKRVQQVKYNQMITLKGDSGIQFAPQAAGHMIGGAIWRISRQGEEEIVYAVDFNHRKERHLNGCVFDTICRPTLLITDAYNALYNQPRRRDRDEQLITTMLETCRGGGDCLVVIDTAGRVLEIAHLIDSLWSNSEAGLQTYNLVMLSYVATTVVDFAKSQVEWMSDKIMKSFDAGRHNPFAFKNIKLCHSLPELAGVRSPKVVLCSGPDMESGFSRELFLEWSSDSRNSIVLTSRSGERTLGSKLIRMADPNSGSGSRHVTIEVKRRIRLEGAELEQHRKKKAEKDAEAARLRLEASRRNARLGLSRDDEDDDSDDDEALANDVAALTGLKIGAQATNNAEGGKVTANSQPLSTPRTVPTVNVPVHDNPYDIMWKWEHHQKSTFFKQNKKSFPMFHFVEEKVKWDDYGETIRPEEYMTAESLVPEQVSEEIDEKKPLKSDTSSHNVPLPIEEEWPTKCIKYFQKLEVLCKVHFVDFEGRSDGESMKKILEQIRPKQLIVVHGSAASTRHLAQYAHDKELVQGKIFTPRLGEIIDATVESHIFQVSLSDAVMSSLMFQAVKDTELSWIDAKVIRRAVAGETASTSQEQEIEPMDTGEEDKEKETEGDTELQKRVAQKRRQDTFVLDVLPQSTIPTHKAVFINDPKLTDVKQMLIQHDYTAEFSSGVLFVNGIVSIKRNEAGRFHIEGRACVPFYKIRDLIYQQFAIV